MTPGPLSADRRRVIGAVAIVLVLAAGTGMLAPPLVAPSRAEDADKAESTVSPPPARVTTKNGLAVLTLSAAEQQASGIETARVLRAPARESLVGYGSVLDPAPLSESQQPLPGGRERGGDRDRQAGRVARRLRAGEDPL